MAIHEELVVAEHAPVQAPSLPSKPFLARRRGVWTIVAVTVLLTIAFAACAFGGLQIPAPLAIGLGAILAFFVFGTLFWLMSMGLSRRPQ